MTPNVMDTCSQQAAKTGDKYPARPGEWEKAIVVAADIGYLVPDLQK